MKLSDFSHESVLWLGFEGNDLFLSCDIQGLSW